MNVHCLERFRLSHNPSLFHECSSNVHFAFISVSSPDDILRFSFFHFGRRCCVRCNCTVDELWLTFSRFEEKLNQIVWKVSYFNENSIEATRKSCWRKQQRKNRRENIKRSECIWAHMRSANPMFSGAWVCVANGIIDKTKWLFVMVFESTILTLRLFRFIMAFSVCIAIPCSIVSQHIRTVCFASHHTFQLLTFRLVVSSLLSLSFPLEFEIVCDHSYFFSCLFRFSSRSLCSFAQNKTKNTFSVIEETSKMFIIFTSIGHFSSLEMNESCRFRTFSHENVSIDK